MGRRNSPNCIPQRSRLVANREQRWGAREQHPRLFGIRRIVEESVQTDILDTCREYQADNDIPENIELRQSLHVTLLPIRAINRQLCRGLLAGYQLGQLGASLEHMDGHQHRTLTVRRGEVRVYKRASLYMQVISPELEAEIASVHAILGRAGLKGYEHNSKDYGLHITLGGVGGRERITPTEEKHVKHVLDDVLPTKAFQLSSWDFYPGGALQEAV